MKIKRKLRQISALLLCLALHGSVTFRPSAAQETQERDIEAKEVLRNRPQSKNPKTNLSYRYRLKTPATSRQTAQTVVGSGRSRKATPKTGLETTVNQFPVGPPPKDKTYVTVGVTLWRVRLATEAESKDTKVPKEQMMWEQQERKVVVTRISDESPVTDKDLVQMSIEYLPSRNGADAGPSNHAGYLYVINREQFPNGSLKNARLIFPTRLTYGGDNRVLPGKTVTLPDPRRPFRIGRSSSGQAQTYETYTVILSPVPLDSELPQELGRKAVELSSDLIAKWEQQWGAGEVRADLLGGMGQTRTQRELKANGDTDEARDTKDSDEDLTQDDPPPQIVFRRVVKPGATMLVTVRLPFKEAATKP